MLHYVQSVEEARMHTQIFYLLLLSSLVQSIKFYNGRPDDGFVPRSTEEAKRKTLNSNSVKSFNFTQILDHFNPSDTRTWQQVKNYIAHMKTFCIILRLSQVYLVNNEFYSLDKSGPMFVMISGEAPIDVG